MLQEVTRPVQKESPERWTSALDRAIAEALDVYISTDGTAFVESASRPGLLYIVTRESCTCPAGDKGRPCKHRACFLAQIGELCTVTAEGITFTGNSDRQEIRINGRYFGFAAYTDDGGWTLFQGRFPHARRRGSFCTLDEIERMFATRNPVVDLAILAHAA